MAIPQSGEKYFDKTRPDNIMEVKEILDTRNFLKNVISDKAFHDKVDAGEQDFHTFIRVKNSDGSTNVMGWKVIEETNAWTKVE